MRKSTSVMMLSLSLVALLSCSYAPTLTTEPLKAKDNTPHSDTLENDKKIVVYQVFTRLFGNKNTTNKPWGTLEENGVGKFADFTPEALSAIKAMGVSHIWYTGVPHHALVRDYTAYGISNDDPDVIKGRAGSPYAVKDYYNVNPDLAVNPEHRLAEFEALIARTHQHDMKVIIDIVPNHVARVYKSLSKPAGTSDFGENDNKDVEYARDNNFYYVPNTAFSVPKFPASYQVLGGQKHELADNQFTEFPAKWTGNGSREAQPAFDDWYETVKINYGVRPDGSYDFDTLPDNYAQKSWQAHYDFWQHKDVPDSWVKFRDITQYWLAKGVDGFRYDMAEMVPVEFWSYLNSHIKHTNPNAFLLAEVYQPHLYRDYIKLGKMDYLYDKVEFYDSLKLVMQGKGKTSALVETQKRMADIEHHMLHFLENHDEQRIASPEFAGDAKKGMPAMVVSSTISTSPTMLYFGQDVGEPGDRDAGFGKASRTTIFDYWGVPHHQRFMNEGKFDGKALSKSEQELHQFYKTLLNFTVTAPALMGEYLPLHEENLAANSAYNEQQLAFARWSNTQKLIVVSHFNAEQSISFNLNVPSALINKWQLKDGNYALRDALSHKKYELIVQHGQGSIALELTPLASVILEL